jgi:hypothetical protein
MNAIEGRIEAGLDMPFDLPAERHKEQTRLKAKVAEHNREWDAHAAECAALKATPVQQMTGKQLAQGDRLRQATFDLAQRALALRDELESYYAAIIDTDYHAAKDALLSQAESAKADILAKLVAIGYPQAWEGGGRPISVEAFAGLHPAVAGPWRECECLSTGAPDAARSLNAGHAAKLREQLAAMRDNAVAGLAC